MKIKYLKIDAFKNLRNFELDLTGNENDILVTIGKNGTGKSNFLEAIVLIFRDLIMRENDPPFSYELHYICRGKKVEVVCNQSIKGKYSFSIENGKLDNRETFWKKKNGVFLNLPEYIFAYYSGISNRLEHHFDSSQKKFYNELKNGVDSAFRPLFYARPIHSNFVLLAFYAFEDQNIKKFLEEYLQITSFHSALFVVPKPKWKSKEGDIRFWKAKGIVADFMSKLFSKSLLPIKDFVSVRKDFRHKDEIKECWYLFLESQAKLIELAHEYGSNVEFFKALESTYISDLIQETRIRVEKKSSGNGAITFKELSEGEQQLLTVLGLLKFSNFAESLFLLDEPDTHLSPIWGHEYLKMLKRISGEYGNSQMFLSTHKPTTISGLSGDQIIIFEKQNDESICANISKISPKGLSSDGILTQIFDMEYTYDEGTYLEMLTRRRLVAKKMFDPQNITKKELVELNELTDKLSDYSENYADGLFSTLR